MYASTQEMMLLQVRYANLQSQSSRQVVVESITTAHHHLPAASAICSKNVRRQTTFRLEGVEAKVLA